MPDITKYPRGVPGRNLIDNRPPDAMWTDPRTILGSPHWQYKKGNIFLGSLDGQPIGVTDNRHLMTFAGSRAGKGVSAIIPNLITYPGSVLVIDPKGENAEVTKISRDGTLFRQTGLRQDVFVLDPFGRSGHKTSSFNPLSMIDPDNDDAVDDAALVADGLVIPLQGDNKHWSDAARNFLRGLVLYMRAGMPDAMQNLIWLRRLLTNDQTGFDLLLTKMVGQGEACHGVIRRAANSLQAKWPEERSSVISTLIEQTDFLDSPRMANVLERNDFDLADLKRKPTTVYVCLPAARMATHNRWFRVIINLALQAMEKEQTEPPYPVLFMMDEFAILDHLSSLEKAAGQIAGFHVRLWPILQDLSQLKAIYKDSWETFMGNAGLLQFFGNNDLTTLEYISKRLGRSTIARISQSEISRQAAGQALTGESIQPHETELMVPDEVAFFFSRQKKAQILFWPGAAPIALDRVEYYDKNNSFFAGKFQEKRQRG